MPVVSNTSPLSNLAIIGRLDLLRDQFARVFIPEAVARELKALSHSQAKAAIEDAVKEGWLEVRAVEALALVRLLKVNLHEGESEAIALAVELKASYTLLDEREARAAAQQMSLEITGVLGVLLRAKKLGKIVALRPVIEQLRREAHFFISSEIEDHLLKLADE